MAEIKVPFHRAAITKAEEDAVLDVLRSGWLTTGKYALEFEKKFSTAVGGGDEAHISAATYMGSLALIVMSVLFVLTLQKSMLSYSVGIKERK